MLCKHLRVIEEEMLKAGIKVDFRGQAWSQNCREWVYFDCYIDRNSIRQRVDLDDCIIDHDNLDAHTGQESGLYCTNCKDGIMGVHKKNVSYKSIVIK